MTFTELRNSLPEGRIEGRLFATWAADCTDSSGLSTQEQCSTYRYEASSLCVVHDSNSLVAYLDISPNNILCGVKNMSPFEELEEAELVQPSARKRLEDRVIYLSRQMRMTTGKPVISDLGSARFGQESYRGDIMPLVYRALEVILDMEWSSKVDIWSMGVMVSLLAAYTRHLLINSRSGIC